MFSEFARFQCRLSSFEPISRTSLMAPVTRTDTFSVCVSSRSKVHLQSMTYARSTERCYHSQHELYEYVLISHKHNHSVRPVDASSSSVRLHESIRNKSVFSFQHQHDTARIRYWAPCCYPQRRCRYGLIDIEQSIDIASPRGPQQQTRRTLLQRSIDGTDRQTDRRTLHRYTDPAINILCKQCQ